MRTRQAVAAATAAAFLAGCATQPQNVTAQYVSASRYDSWTCAKLNAESEELSARIGQVSAKLSTAATADAVLLTVGMVIFWPALLAMPFTGGKVEEVELSRLKGEADAVNKALKNASCDALVPAKVAQ